MIYPLTGHPRLSRRHRPPAHPGHSLRTRQGPPADASRTPGQPALSRPRPPRPPHRAHAGLRGTVQGTRNQWSWSADLITSHRAARCKPSGTSSAWASSTSPSMSFATQPSIGEASARPPAVYISKRDFSPCASARIGFKPSRRRRSVTHDLLTHRFFPDALRLRRRRRRLGEHLPAGGRQEPHTGRYHLLASLFQLSPQYAIPPWSHPPWSTSRDLPPPPHNAPLR